MLFAPPPGYNPATVNRQNVSAFNVPGQQGGTAQGYLANMFRSNYSVPSSYAVPSSVDAPNPYYAQRPAGPQQMVRALNRAL